MASGGVERYVLEDGDERRAYYQPLDWEKDYFDSVNKNSKIYFQNWGLKVDLPCGCEEEIGVMFHRENCRDDIIYCSKHCIGIMRRYFENVISELRVPNIMHIEED